MCEYYRNISEDEKIPKTNYPNTKNKNMSDIDRERTRGWCKLGICILNLQILKGIYGRK